MPHHPTPPPDRLEQLARDYPLTMARQIVEAVVSPLPSSAPPAVRWSALVAAHGAAAASSALRRACELDHHPNALVVVRRAELEGYVDEAA